MRIVITGTPGVGKHTVAEILSKRLSAKIIDINELAFRYNAIIGKDYAYIVDTEKVKSIIKDELSDNCIVVGHLAPYVLDNKDIDCAIVLRRSPYELEKVYAERGYDSEKMRDNLSSEILGVIAYDCRRFDRVIEIDCTNKSVDEIVEEIISSINSKESRIGIVDWLELIKDDIDKFDL